jgi:predicted permease
MQLLIEESVFNPYSKLTTMLKHHILLALRNFKKHKASFAINLIGLSAGLTCSILIYLWVNDEVNVIKFHKKDSQLYQVMEHQQYAEDVMTTQSTPGLLSETLKSDIPEIEYAITTTWRNSFTLTVNDNNIKARGYYTSPDFFNVYTFPLIHGNADQVLQDKSNIVISETLAAKLFENSLEAVGKSVEFQHDKTFIVSGVYQDMPNNSSIQMDFLLSFELYKDENSWVTNWGSNGPQTYIILKEGSDANQVSNKIANVVLEKNEQSNVTLFLQKYSDRYLYGRYENRIQSGGRIEYVRLFSIIAIFILIIACINFMNLSTARATRRAKEVGIKKAVGAHQGSLVFQFLTESIITSLTASMVSLLIVILFIPQFNEITDKQIALQFDWSSISVFTGITLFTGVFAGSYPAFYLSSFNPVTVLKGVIRGSAGEVWARKGLVIFQFTLSIILIVAVVVVYQQIEFVQNKNLGFEKDNLIRFDLNGRANENTETFTQELKNIPGVMNAASIGHGFVGQQNNTSGLEWEGKHPDDIILFENFRVDYGLIETVGIEMKEGRSFSKEFSTDTTKIIFNEAAIEVMGLKNPIGQVITMWEEYKFEIIGVVKNFNFQSLHDEVDPAFFRLTPDNTWNMMVKIAAGEEKETIGRLQTFHSEYNPGFTLDYKFMDEDYAQQYAAEQRVATLSKYFAGFAILISCLGLFGLATFTAQRRLKEIGVRKALGSSARNIVYLLTREFTGLVGVSILISLPISYFIGKQWLTRFAYRIDLDIWFFIGAGLTALVIAWLTVSTQAIRAANSNPAECLKDE